MKTIPNNLVESEWCELTKISRNSKTHIHKSSILPGCNLANCSPSTERAKGVGRSQTLHLPLVSSPQRGAGGAAGGAGWEARGLHCSRPPWL